MFVLYLDGNSVTKLAAGLLSEDLGIQEGAKDFMSLTQKDLNGIRQICEFEKDLFKLLIHSFCPSIYGHEIVKVKSDFIDFRLAFS